MSTEREISPRFSEIRSTGPFSDFTGAEDRYPSWLHEQPLGTTIRSTRGATALNPHLRFGIAIPVRDEAHRVARCLEALVAQIDRSGRAIDPAQLEIFLLLNNCHDASASMAEKFCRKYPFHRIHIRQVDLRPPFNHVGWARRLAMNWACRRLLVTGAPGAILATTDADSVVAPNWLTATSADIVGGAEAVSGRLALTAHEWMTLPVELRSFLKRQRAAERRHHLGIASGSEFDRHDGHFDHCGASLALTADLYLRCGGLPPLPCGEDAALFHAIIQAGGRFRHSPLVTVFTSARLNGRAAGGMASTLATWRSYLSEREGAGHRSPNG